MCMTGIEARIAGARDCALSRRPSWWAALSKPVGRPRSGGREGSGERVCVRRLAFCDDPEDRVYRVRRPRAREASTVAARSLAESRPSARLAVRPRRPQLASSTSDRSSEHSYSFRTFDQPRPPDSTTAPSPLAERSPTECPHHPPSRRRAGGPGGALAHRRPPQ